MFAIDSVSVIGQVATCDPDGHSILTSVTVTIPNHSVTTTSGGLLVDGAMWTTATPASDWLAVRPHRIGPDGYAEISFEGGTIGVHRANGTDPEAIGTFLDGLFYCQVFLDGPDGWGAGSGILTVGQPTDDPASYRVNQPLANN